MNDAEKSTASGASDNDDDYSSSAGTGSSKGNNGSTSTGESESAGTYSSSNNDSSTGKGQLARRETENVNRLRYMVLAILFMAAVGVSVMVFLISSNSEDEEMATQFDSASARLSDAFDAIRTERIATLASLAVAAIAHGVDHSRDWPFVSLSSYQQRAFTAKQNSGVLQVSIAPYVSAKDRELWEEYIVSNEAEVDWIERSVTYQQEVGAEVFIKNYGESFRGNVNTSHSIKRWDDVENTVVPLDYGTKDDYLPFWEMSPLLSYDEVNIDMLQEGDERGYYGNLSIAEGAIVIGDMNYHMPGGIDSPDATTSSYAQLLSIDAGREVRYEGDPMTNLFIPIFDSFEDDRVPRAVLVGFFNWGNLFKGVLPDNLKGIDVVLKNTCFDPFTFRVVGENVIPRGKGDLHENAFNDWEVKSDILQSGRTADGTKTGLGFVDRECKYSISIYPSEAFANEFETPTPWILVSAVAGVLLFAIIMFFVYDHLVERRQSLVLRKAVQSTAIVSSLFPKTVRDRLMNGAASPEDGDVKNISAFRDRLRNKQKQGLNPQADKLEQDSTLPGMGDYMGDTIADLFPHCTVLFADIAGFTAWSSTRDPSQVFTLLQNLYQAFDKVAMRRRVFKVETIGDSYVAVTGLPEPQQDHAIIMAKFARDCLQKMEEVTSALEVRLGPDTTDLSIRVGMNSGQVTGGVLRGDRARFQLFGDTVNTAARMESTGERGRIQLSQSTCDLLVSAGKERWVFPRKDTVAAKGKGILQTYWLQMDGGPRAANMADSSSAVLQENAVALVPNTPHALNSATVAGKQESRLVGWMTEVLLDYVKQIVAKNKVARGGTPRSSGVAYRHDPGTICLDELVESFPLPKENTQEVSLAMDQYYRSIELHPDVAKQLRQYVAEISYRYHAENPFHNFAHACHVTMSVHKLMKRVVSDHNGTDESTTGSSTLNEDNKHSATYGILTSDPLTLFAIVFSGLIHDVDHRGVSNMQLSIEDPELAEHYRNKSIAEQNSFDIAWDLLMMSQFDSLRQAIFPTLPDLMRFRQVVVNTVLATDIFDKELGDMRKARWDRVFGDIETDGSAAAAGSESIISKNTRATIVLEHIIQASDVSHTMQHWHVYTKWNRRLFEEMHLAFTQGRMGKDPSEFWYQGELGFFDNYVIPLAKKLQECRVFGVSSDEYLNYAMSNRAEWERKGQSIVEDMVISIQPVEQESSETEDEPNEVPVGVV